VFKSVKNTVWAFDIEWVPDPNAARLLVDGLENDATDLELMEALWKRGGATVDDPRPFLKTALSRIVSIAAVERRKRDDGSIALSLVSLPKNVDDPEETKESSLISRFLLGVGQKKPQLVGYYSMSADIVILIQRGIINGVEAKAFAQRPDKPWEGVDYFARGSEYNIDLLDILGARGRGNPSLHEVATQSGIPGKFGVGGAQVADMWLRGELKAIVDYNECDAVSTYLLWLRVAHFGGFFDDAGYKEEQDRVRAMLEKLSADEKYAHMAAYLDQWDRLQSVR